MHDRGAGYRHVTAHSRNMIRRQPSGECDLKGIQGQSIVIGAGMVSERGCDGSGDRTTGTGGSKGNCGPSANCCCCYCRRRTSSMRSYL